MQRGWPKVWGPDPGQRRKVKKQNGKESDCPSWRLKPNHESQRKAGDERDCQQKPNRSFRLPPSWQAPTSQRCWLADTAPARALRPSCPQGRGNPGPPGLRAGTSRMRGAPGFKPRPFQGFAQTQFSRQSSGELGSGAWGRTHFSPSDPGFWAPLDPVRAARAAWPTTDTEAGAGFPGAAKRRVRARGGGEGGCAVLRAARPQCPSLHHRAGFPGILHLWG